MASRLDDLIREHAERLDQLAGAIDLTDVTRGPRNDTIAAALIETEHTPPQTEGRRRWPIVAVAAAAVAIVVGVVMLDAANHGTETDVPANQPTTDTAAERVARDHDTETQGTSAPSNIVATTAGSTPAEVIAAEAVRVGFIGLPPDGATPSRPERGELVEHYFVPKWGSQFGTSVRLYADGRLIWSMRLPPPSAGASSGYVEQRLTPEGVELVRTHELITVKDPLRLPDWLPATAWDDQTIRAFIPSSFAACLYVVDPVEPIPDPPIEQELALLPAPARELLRDTQTVPYLVGPNDGTPNCLALTTQDARLLDTALSDAAFEQDEQRNASVLNYHIDYPGLEGSQLHISLEPVFPDGTISCSDCG